jgi:hypothetical protein
MSDLRSIENSAEAGALEIDLDPERLAAAVAAVLDWEQYGDELAVDLIARLLPILRTPTSPRGE